MVFVEPKKSYGQKEVVWRYLQQRAEPRAHIVVTIEEPPLKWRET